MSFTILSAIILLSMLLFVFWQARRGHKVGFGGAVINLALLLLSTVAASMLASVDSAVDEEVYKILKRNGAIASFAPNVPAFRITAEFLLELFTSVFMMAIYCLVMWLILSIIVSIVRRRMNRGSRAPMYQSSNGSYVERNTRRLGAFVGVISGLLLTVVVFTPIATIPRMARDTVEVVRNYEQDRTELNSDTRALLNCADDFMGTVIYSSGAKTLFDISTAFYVGDEKTTLSRELEKFDEISSITIRTALPLMTSVDEWQINTYDKFLHDTEGSVIMDLILLSNFRSSINAWSKQEGHLGVYEPHPTDNPYLRELFRSVSTRLSKSTLDTVRKDITTFRKLNIFLATQDSVYDTDDYYAQLNHFMGENVGDNIENILLSDKTTSELAVLVDDVKLGFVAEMIYDMSEYHRQELYIRLSTAANETVYRYLYDNSFATNMANAIGDVFTEFGFVMPREIYTVIADKLINEWIYGYGIISADQMDTFFGSYL